MMMLKVYNDFPWIGVYKDGEGPGEKERIDIVLRSDSAIQYYLGKTTMVALNNKFVEPCSIDAACHPENVVVMTYIRLKAIESAKDFEFLMFDDKDYYACEITTQSGQRFWLADRWQNKNKYIIDC